MRSRRRYRVPRRPRIPPSASIAPVAQHRGGNAQLACDPAQRPIAAHQQGYRFPLELIRKMTPSLAHSTPFRSRRSLAKVSTNSREPHLSLMALTISSGFVVDDASVVLENVTRHIAGITRMEATMQGVREVGFNVVSISLSLVAAFLPVLLMAGIIT